MIMILVSAAGISKKEMSDYGNNHDHLRNDDDDDDDDDVDDDDEHCLFS